MKLLRIFLSGILAVSNFVWAGHEVQNGGSVILVGENTYKLADLAFRPLSGNKLSFAPELESKFTEIRSQMEEILLSPFTDAQGRDFFDSQVFNPYVDYVFVASLPSFCRFYSSENFENTAHLMNIACTSGHVTYILPELFESLVLEDKAFLLLHERLHAFAPLEPYDVKSEIVAALFFLHTHFFPNFRAVQDLGVQEFCTFSLAESPRGLDLANNLSRRLRQITNRSFPGQRYADVQFSPQGGLLITLDVPSGPRPTWQIRGEGVQVCLGSRLVSKNAYTFPRPTAQVEHVIEGRNFRIMNTEVWVEASFGLKSFDTDWLDLLIGN